MRHLFQAIAIFLTWIYMILVMVLDVLVWGVIYGFLTVVAGALAVYDHLSAIWHRRDGNGEER